ncbi:hypothetical protein PV326_009568 [Microctonus aethiopoides]|nr:hypothetical protein PV326_009568 [Microctonus aethiopoides]
MRPGPPSSSRRRPPRRQQQPFEGPRIDHHHHYHRHHHHNHQQQQQQQQHHKYNHVGNSGGFSITTFATTLLLLLLISGPCLALIEPVIIGDHLQQSLDHHQQRSLTSRSISNTPGLSMWSNKSSNIERINRKSKNLTIGYLTAIKGGLKDRQGLAISGAITMALDEDRKVASCKGLSVAWQKPTLSWDITCGVINNDPNILPNVNLVMRWSDTRGETVETTRAIVDMICDGVAAFFGPEGSCYVEAIVAQSRNIPMISYVS